MQQTPDSAKPRRSAPLTKERIALLNDIGFTWTIRSRDSLGESWNQRLIELKEFKARHGVSGILQVLHQVPRYSLTIFLHSIAWFRLDTVQIQNLEFG